MTNDTATARSVWRTLLTAAGVFGFIVPVVVGQNPPPQSRPLPAAATLPAFEEASIRPNNTEGRGGRGGQFQPTRWVSQNVTLKTILKNTLARQGVGGPNTALPLLDSQVIGGPDWLDTDKFDVVATTPASSQPTPPMPAAAPPGQPQPPLPLPNCGGIQFGPGQLTARGAPMELFVQTLTSVPVVTGIDRPVVDRTGIQGNYAFALTFAPAGTANADLDRPELVTALREQLGLTLEATHAPVDVLVIDSVEKPTPN